MKNFFSKVIGGKGLNFAEAQEALELLSSSEIIAAGDACAALLAGGGPLDTANLVQHCVRLYMLPEAESAFRANILFAIARNARDILDYPQIRSLVFNAASSGNRDLQVNAVHSLLELALKGDARSVPALQSLTLSSDEYVRGNATKALAELSAR